MSVSVRACWAAVVLAVVSLAAGARDARVADAAEKRDLRAVTALVKQGIDVNAPQADGASALHWAAHWNDLPMTQALLTAGAKVNAANDYGVTPLFLAATNGSVDVLAALLGGGANPNAALPTGETVLMTAVRSGSAAAVKELLTGGADPNAAQTSKGQTALMWAATALKVDVARILIERGANVQARSATGFTPLMFAAREGGIEFSRLLLASGADVNASAADGNTPLLVATVRGHAALAMFLLDQGARPDGDAVLAGYTPLHWATSRGEQSLTTGDLDAPGEWNTLPGIPDRDAKLALIKKLIDRGALINARVSKSMPSPQRGTGAGPRLGATPFYTAALSGDAEVMRLMLANGADPLIRSQDGATPLIAVIAGGNSFTARRITENDRIEAITVALAAGNDIEAQDEKGYRAMHTAASSEFHGIIKFLLTQGADLNPVTKSRTEKEGSGFVAIAGQSPLGIVEGTFNGGSYNERPETAAFLRTLGAKSIGRATLQTYIKSFEEENKPKTK